MDIFHELDKEFHFTLDAAADERNKKCYMYRAYPVKTHKR